MAAPWTLIGILWALWCVGWLLAAPWSRRTVERQNRGAVLLRLAVVVAASALYQAPSGGTVAWNRPLFAAAPILPWVGLLLVVAGLGHSVWARVHLGRLWSSTITLKEGHSIVRSGPYALSRHPIYTGILLALLGSTLARNTRGAAAGFVLLLIGFLVKSAQEETLLVKHFGEAYEDYRRRTRRLIPHVW